MVRPTRTTNQIKDAIILNAAVYTIARTDWEGERREVKKKALRTIGRLTRQLCERGGHKLGRSLGWGTDLPTVEAADLVKKCPVCDPSGDVKREAQIGAEAMEERRRSAAEAFDIATGRRKAPPAPKSLGNCKKCQAMVSVKYLVDGVCDICRDTPAEGD